MPDGTQTTQSRTPVVDQIFGHNKAPIDEVLDADFADLRAGIAQLIHEVSEAVPNKIAGDDDLSAAGDGIKRLRAGIKRLDEIRDTEGRPMLEAKRTLDAFFKTQMRVVEDAIAPIQKNADTYVRARAAADAERRRRQEAEARAEAEKARQKAENAKSAEAAAKAIEKAEAAEAAAEAAAAGNAEPIRGSGSTVSTRKAWRYEIEDHAALEASLGPLGPYLAPDAVERAIAAAVKVRKGATAIPGVRPYEVASAGIR